MKASDLCFAALYSRSSSNKTSWCSSCSSSCWDYGSAEFINL